MEGKLSHLINDFPLNFAERLALAEQGDACGQYMVGLTYANGDGVDQDYETAMIWFRRSAEQEHANAMFYLGSMYQYGNCGPIDFNQAKKWAYPRATYMPLGGIDWPPTKATKTLLSNWD